MAFPIRLVIRRFSCKFIESSIRNSYKISFNSKKLIASSVLNSYFSVSASGEPIPHIDTGIEHEEHEEENVESDEESFKKKRPAQLNLIYETLSKNPPNSEEEIFSFRAKIVNSGNVVTENNVDAIVIGICSTLKNSKFANSYLNMLESKQIEINVATAGRYLRLCYYCNQVDDESKILQMCNNIRKKMPLLDATTAENVIHGLSLTSEWKQGLELVDMIKETCSPSGSTYSSLIIAAFRNNEFELGWQMMEECIKQGKVPNDAVYCNLLDLVIAKRSGEGKLELAEQLLEFLSFHELRPSLAVARKLKYTFESMNWKGHFTSISERGICRACNAEMTPILISRPEFKKLSKTFLEKVLVGPDVFSKSLPEEVEAFQELMAKEAPFNTVIDGLNIAYSSGGGKVPPHIRAGILQSVVAHFVDLSHKILVLGRSHMESWPTRQMDYIRKNSKLFLTQNLSQDDPFLLYAAMSSGPATCFLSRDLMRSHAYRLKIADPSLSSLFRKWQISHQIRLIGVERNGRVQLKLPLDYSPNVQKVEGNWHIPYQAEESGEDDAEDGKKMPVLTRSHLDSPTNWLCLTEKRFKEKFKKFNIKRDLYHRSY